MKKNIKALVVLSFGALFLAACGNTDTGKDSASNNGMESDEPLLVMFYEELSEDDAYSLALDKWEEDTGNKVERLIVPYDDQISSFRSMVQNNDAPDLLITTRLTRLYPEEFKNLDDVIDRTIFDETALKVINQDSNLDERMLVAPSQYTATTWYYNADAFAEANITPPTEESPWTLDETYEMAKKLQENSSVNYGMTVDFSRARYDNLMYSNGGSITSRDGEEILVNANSPENIKTLETFVEKNEAGILPQTIWSGGSADNPADYFLNGDVGIHLSGTFNYTKFMSDADFEFAVMPSPVGSKGKSVIPGGEGWAIPEVAKNGDLAGEFLKWFYENNNFSEYLNNDLGVNFVNGVEVNYEDENTKRDFTLIQNEMDYVTEEYLLDHAANWTNYLDAEYRDMLRRTVAGEITAEEGLNSFAEELKELSDWKIKN